MKSKPKNESFTPEHADLIIARHAAFCAVFCDQKRLRIMWYLRDGERRVNEIAEHLGITIQNASQHLRLMRDRGALASHRNGNAVFYRIANPKFVKGAQLIREGVIEEMRRLNVQGE
jgi:ArsR family transcriptional regulator